MSPLPTFRRRPFTRALLAALASASFALPAFTQVTTQGFRNLARTEEPGTLLSHPVTNGSNQGRTTIVTYHKGWVIVAYEQSGSAPDSDLIARVFDISDPANLVRRQPSDFGFPSSYAWWYRADVGFNSHAIAWTGNYTTTNAFYVETFGGTVDKPRPGGPANYGDVYPFGGANRSAMAGPWKATMFWYDKGDGQGPASNPSGRGDVANPVNFIITKNSVGENSGTTRILGQWDHFGSFGITDWHPIFFGDLLIYIKAGGSARDGIVVYRLRYNNFDDLATRTIEPELVGSYPGGLNAYWPVLFSDGTKLYVVSAGTAAITAVDITETVHPSGTGVMEKAGEHATAMNGATYPIFQDQFAFVDGKKFDMNLLVAGHANPIVLTLPKASHNINTQQASLPLGNLWLTGGSGDNTDGMAVWVQQKAPDTTRPVVAFSNPQANRGNYPRHAPLSFIVHEIPRNGGLRNGIDFLCRPVGANNTLGTPVPGFLIMDQAGIITFNPDAPLAAGTTYQVDFVADDNGTPSNKNDDKGFQDAAGNLIIPHSFRFSTGSSVNAAPAPVISSVTASSYQPLPGGTATVTVNATGTGLQYSFNINGTWTTWSTTKTFTTPALPAGRHRVLVRVKNAEGTISTETIDLLAITPPTGPFPTQSNTLVVGDDAGVRRVWSVNPDANTVTVVNASSGAKLGEYPVGRTPRTITRDANGRYWVACQGDDEIVVLNANGTVFQRIDTGYGSAPYAVAANPAGTSVFATYQGSGKVVRFSVPAGAGAITAPVVSASSVHTPRAIAISGNGARVFVTRFISGEYSAEVHEFNGTSTLLTRTRTIYLDYVRTADNNDRGAGILNYLAGISISPDGQYALVAAKKDNVLRGDLFEVGDLTPDNTVRAVLAVINLSSNTEVTNGRRDLDNSDSPTSIAFSPLGDTAFVTLQGNNRVIGLDTLALGATVDPNVITTVRLNTGAAPQGVVADATSKRIYVQNFMGRSVDAFQAAALFDQNRTSLPSAFTTATVAHEPLHPTVLLGKTVFYDAADPGMSAEGYISCATCHVDGSHDGRVWDFTGRGEGLRRTTDLRGRGGLAHGNVHWSGNFDEIQDFVLDITRAFGGTGFLDENQTPHPALSTNLNAGRSVELDALAAYVSSLGVTTVPKSPHRNADGTLTNLATPGASALRGKALFESTGTSGLDCVSCHGGSRFTESVHSRTSPILRNVGTLSVLSGSRLFGTLAGIDTPSLLGGHASFRHLHHGLALSLEEVFAYTGGDIYEAENATPLPSTYIAPVVRTDPAEDGGGGTFMEFVGGKAMHLTRDTEDDNHNGSLNTGEDRNGNGSIDRVSPGNGVTFTGIDGGTGGAARLSIRYAAQGDGAFVYRVNGGPNQTVPFLNQRAAPAHNTAGFRWATVDINLNSGTTNTIVLRHGDTTNARVTVDLILVSHAGDLSAANPHRKVLARSTQDQADLMAYLRQIDGRDASGSLLIRDNLTARYAFETTTLGIDSGATGVANTGVVYGSGITRVTADSPSGSAYTSWNGNSANRIEVPDHDDLDGGTQFTVAFRIKPDAVGIDGNGRGILSKRTGVGTNLAYTAFLYTDGKIHVDVAGGSRISSPQPVSTTEWTHGAIVYDASLPTTDRVKLYVNGVLVAKMTNTSTSLANSIAPLHIGIVNPGHAYAYSGLMDDLRIYKGKALTADEVAVLASSRD